MLNYNKLNEIFNINLLLYHETLACKGASFQLDLGKTHTNHNIHYISISQFLIQFLGGTQNDLQEGDTTDYLIISIYAQLLATNDLLFLKKSTKDLFRCMMYL